MPSSPVPSNLQAFADAAALKLAETAHGQTIPPLALRPRAAARALGVCEKTLFNWTKAGIIPSVKIGAAVLYRVADLDATLARLAQGGGV